MTVGFWYGLITGMVAGFTLCVISVLAVMMWYDWKDGIDIEFAEDDEPKDD